MKTETIVSKATELAGLLAGAEPLRELNGTDDEAALYRALKGLNSGTRRVIQGPWGPQRLRALCAPEAPKPDRRSPELKELGAEVDQLDSEYQEAVKLWERCVVEEIKNPSRSHFMTTGGNVVASEVRPPAEAQRKLETAAALRDAASEKLQAKRADYYSKLRAEQAERRAAEQQAQQAEQAAEKARAAEARKQSFAADARKFFGLRA